MRHKPSKALTAHVVPYKGGDHTWSVEQCIRYVYKWCVYGGVIIRTDQEAAL